MKENIENTIYADHCLQK